MKKETTKKSTALVKKDNVTRGTATRIAPQDEAHKHTSDERVDIIRKGLDSMEAVQLTMATGAALIGMEMLALKKELGTGEFANVFAERIERPRFGIRTAQRYMNVAESARVNLLRAGYADLGDVFDMPPSDMPMDKRQMLSKALGDMLGGKTLSNLLMGEKEVRQLPAPKATTTAAAMEEMHQQTWKKICDDLARYGLDKKTWKHLDKDQVGQVRQCLTAVLGEMPKG